MIYDTKLSLAVKNEFGQYEIREFTLFDMYNINSIFKNLEFRSNKNREIKFKIKCPICNNYHYYSFKIKNFYNIGMMIGGCEILGLPLFFLGERKKVNERINKYKVISKENYIMV